MFKRAFLLFLVAGSALMASDTFAIYVNSPDMVKLYGNFLTAIRDIMVGPNSEESYWGIIRFVFLTGAFFALLQGVLMTWSGKAMSALKPISMFILVSLSLMVLTTGKVDLIVKSKTLPTYCSTTSTPVVNTTIDNFPYIMGYILKGLNLFGENSVKFSEKGFSSVYSDKFSLTYGGLGHGIRDMLDTLNADFSLDNNDTSSGSSVRAFNLKDFMAQCLIVPMSAKGKDGEREINELLSTNNIFHYIEDLYSSGRTVEGDKPGNWKMSYGGEYWTCSDFFNKIKLRKSKFLDAAACIGHMTPAGAALIMGDPSIVKSNFDDVVLQAASLNALNDTMNHLGAGVDGVSSYFSLGKSRAETMLTYFSNGVYMSKMLPIFQQTIRLLLYALFPFLFIFLFFPGGTKILFEYGKSIIWIETWTPVAAVLNMMLTVKMMEHSKHLYAASGVTSYTAADMLTTGSAIAGTAGYIYLMIPALTWSFLTGSTMMLEGMLKKLGAAAQENIRTESINLDIQKLSKTEQARVTSGIDFGVAESQHYEAVQQGRIDGANLGLDVKSGMDKIVSMNQTDHMEGIASYKTASKLTGLSSEGLGKALGYQESFKRSQQAMIASKLLDRHLRLAAEGESNLEAGEVMAQADHQYSIKDGYGKGQNDIGKTKGKAAVGNRFGVSTIAKATANKGAYNIGYGLNVDYGMGVTAANMEKWQQSTWAKKMRMLKKQYGSYSNAALNQAKADAQRIIKGSAGYEALGDLGNFGFKDAKDPMLAAALNQAYSKIKISEVIKDNNVAVRSFAQGANGNLTVTSIDMNGQGLVLGQDYLRALVTGKLAQLVDDYGPSSMKGDHTDPTLKTLIDEQAHSKYLASGKALVSGAILYDVLSQMNMVLPHGSMVKGKHAIHNRETSPDGKERHKTAIEKGRKRWEEQKKWIQGKAKEIQNQRSKAIKSLDGLISEAEMAKLNKTLDRGSPLFREIEDASGEKSIKISRQLQLILEKLTGIKDMDADMLNRMSIEELEQLIKSTNNVDLDPQTRKALIDLKETIAKEFEFTKNMEKFRAETRKFNAVKFGTDPLNKINKEVDQIDRTRVPRSKHKNLHERIQDNRLRRSGKVTGHDIGNNPKRHGHTGRAGTRPLSVLERNAKKIEVSIDEINKALETLDGANIAGGATYERDQLRRVLLEAKTKLLRLKSGAALDTFVWSKNTDGHLTRSNFTARKIDETLQNLDKNVKKYSRVMMEYNIASNNKLFKDVVQELNKSEEIIDRRKQLDALEDLTSKLKDFKGKYTIGEIVSGQGPFSSLSPTERGMLAKALVKIHRSGDKIKINSRKVKKAINATLETERTSYLEFEREKMAEIADGLASRADASLQKDKARGFRRLGELIKNTPSILSSITNGEITLKDLASPKFKALGDRLLSVNTNLSFAKQDDVIRVATSDYRTFMDYRKLEKKAKISNEILTDVERLAKRSMVGEKINLNTTVKKMNEDLDKLEKLGIFKHEEIERLRKHIASAKTTDDLISFSTRTSALIEEGQREKFKELLDKANAFHEHRSAHLRGTYGSVAEVPEYFLKASAKTRNVIYDMLVGSGNLATKTLKASAIGIVANEVVHNIEKNKDKTQLFRSLYDTGEASVLYSVSGYKMLGITFFAFPEEKERFEKALQESNLAQKDYMKYKLKADALYNSGKHDEAFKYYKYAADAHEKAEKFSEEASRRAKNMAHMADVLEGQEVDKLNRHYMQEISEISKMENTVFSKDIELSSGTVEDVENTVKAAKYYMEHKESVDYVISEVKDYVVSVIQDGKLSTYDKATLLSEDNLKKVISTKLYEFAQSHPNQKS